MIRSNELKFCGSTPIRRTTLALRLVTFMPSTVTVPDVGTRMVSITSVVVLFPAPLGPRNANTSPDLTVNEMSSTALFLP